MITIWPNLVKSLEQRIREERAADLKALRRIHNRRSGRYVEVRCKGCGNPFLRPYSYIAAKSGRGQFCCQKCRWAK